MCTYGDHAAPRMPPPPPLVPPPPTGELAVNDADEEDKLRANGGRYVSGGGCFPAGRQSRQDGWAYVPAAEQRLAARLDARHMSDKRWVVVAVLAVARSTSGFTVFCNVWYQTGMLSRTFGGLTVYFAREVGWRRLGRNTEFDRPDGHAVPRVCAPVCRGGGGGAAAWPCRAGVPATAPRSHGRGGAA